MTTPTLCLASAAILCGMTFAATAIAQSIDLPPKTLPGDAPGWGCSFSKTCGSTPAVTRTGS